MPRAMVHDVTYPHPPARVWAALTRREHLADWLMENDFEAKVGHRFQFRAKPVPGWNGVVECEVKELVPEHRLVFTWAGSDSKGKPYPPTTVTFTLEPMEGGKATRLRLEHTGLVGLRGLLMYLGMNNGWGKRMLRGSLPEVLARMAQASAGPDAATKAPPPTPKQR